MASVSSFVLSIPHRLRAERLRQGMSLQQVADKIGKTKQEVARIEEPANTPNIRTLAAVVFALGGEVVINFADVKAAPK